MSPKVLETGNVDGVTAFILTPKYAIPDGIKHGEVARVDRSKHDIFKLRPRAKLNSTNIDYSFKNDGVRLYYPMD